VYELVPTSDTVVEGFFFNLTVLNQDLDQRPEEPKADSASAQEGKPWCINLIIFALIYIFNLYCNIFLSAH
jgi:hypothetical protein